MDSNELNALLEELEGLIAIGPTHGWKPFWTKAKEIQEAFKAKVRYPSKELQNAAWRRFNDLRDAASAHKKESQNPSREVIQLNSLISELENLVRRGTWLFGPLSFRSIRGPLDALANSVYDWRPAWEKAREIQSMFKGTRYPTKVMHDEAWIRFTIFETN